MVVYDYQFSKGAMLARAMTAGFVSYPAEWPALALW
jgi:hypothetical protein